MLVMYCIVTTSVSYAIAPRPTEEQLLAQMSVKELVAHFADKYNTSSIQLEKVMFCESSGNPKAWNKKDPGVGSKGIFQFQEGTFYSYAARVGIENPDIWNNTHQAQVASYMFSKGLAYHWSCYKKLYRV